jgi:hypothetical protein
MYRIWYIPIILSLVCHREELFPNIIEPTKRVSKSHSHKMVWYVFTQTKYAADLLTKVNLSTCTTMPTPLSTVDKLSLLDGSPLGS